MVGEVPEILARMRLRSHQMEVFGASVMVVSHDLLIHLSLDRFVKQPPREAGAANRPPVGSQLAAPAGWLARAQLTT